MAHANYVTLTVCRPTGDITVELHLYEDKWYVVTSLDETGHDTRLTLLEKANLKARARRGEDETGR